MQADSHNRDRGLGRTSSSSLARGLALFLVQAPGRCLDYLTEQVRKLETHLMPFDDFLVDDLDSLNAYIQRRLMSFMYKFALVCIVIQFFACTFNSIVLRISFSLTFLILVARIFWCIPNLSLDTLKLWGAIDIVWGNVANLLVHYNHMRIYNVDSMLMTIGFFFFTDSIPIKIVATVILLSVDLLLFPFQGVSENLVSYTIGITMVLSFIFAVSQALNRCIIEFVRRYSQFRESKTGELRSKDMFVACISHDLKNPLNSLLGCLEIVSGSATLSEADKENLTTATYSGQILQYLIGNILDMSRIDAGKFDIDRLPMDISEVVTKVTMIEGELSKKRGIKLYRRCLTPIPHSVYGDAMRCSQVLINILGNSIKFTSHGYVALVLRWAENVEEVKAQERAERPDSLIPPEEYFMFAPEDRRPSPGRERNAYSEDYTETVIEEMQHDSIKEKMQKYNESPRSKGGRREPVTVFTEEADNTHPQTFLSKFRNTGQTCINVRTVSDLRPPFANYDSPLLRTPAFTRLPGPEQQGFILDGLSEITGDSGLLVIDIIDTGIGLTEEEQKRLFKPYNQANSSVRAKYGGTGLGLWITKQLVYLMSGFLELRSQPGKGTRFRITLPFKIIKNEDVGSPRSEDNTRGDLSAHSGLMCTAINIGCRGPHSRVAAEIRAAGRSTFGNCSAAARRRTSLMLIEDEKKPDDSLLEQVANQLKTISCKVTYATYSTAVNTLKSSEYRFDTLIAICGGSVMGTSTLVRTIVETIKQADYKPIPVLVVLGIIVVMKITFGVESALQSEYEGLAREIPMRCHMQLTFPLKEGDIVNALAKARGRAAYGCVQYPLW